MKLENMDSDTPKSAKGSSQFILVIKDLLLWRNFRLTLVLFTSILVLLLDIMAHSMISVVSMAGITALLAAIAYRSFVQIMKWKKGGVQDEISRLYPRIRIDIPREEAMQLAGIAVDYLNEGLSVMIGLFLVESWEDSFKFLAILVGLNLLGDCFNGLTMLLFGHVLLFTLPKLYEWYQPLIDTQLQKFRTPKKQDKKTPETKTENTQSRPEDDNSAEEVPFEGQESGGEVNMLYKVCDNEQLLDLLEEEHRKGCRCRDCEHQDLPIEAH